MKTLDLNYFDILNKGETRMRALLSAGSGDFAVPGNIINELWHERLTCPQFLDMHCMFDAATDNHYIVLRYMGADGMLVSCHSDKVVIPEYIHDPVLKDYEKKALEMSAGDVVCFSKNGLTITMTAEKE